MPVLLPTLFVLLWASGYIGGAWGVSAGDVFVLLAARFVIATVVSVPVALRRRSRLTAGVPWMRLTIIALFLMGVQFGCGYTALQQGVHPAISALVVLGLSPLLSTAAAQLLGQERPGRMVWGALAIGFLGTAISALPQLRGADAAAWPLLLTVLAMLGLVVGTLLQKQWATHVDTRTSVAVQSVVGAVLFVPLALVTGATEISDPLPFWLSALWLGAASTAAAVAMQIALLKRHALSTVSGLMLAVPPVTAVMAYVLLDRPIALLTAVGMPIALGAVWLVLRRPAALTDARS